MPEPDTTPAASFCHCGLGTREGCATEPWGCGPASTDPGTTGRTVTGATIPEPQVGGGEAGDNRADKCTCTGTGLNPCTTCPTPWPLIPGAERAIAPESTPALRDRIAVAILARIKKAVVHGPQLFGMDSMTRLLAANEYDLADVVLPIMATERADAYREAAADLSTWAAEGLLNAPEYGSHENVLDAADRLRARADQMEGK